MIGFGVNEKPLLILDVDETLVYGCEEALVDRVGGFRVGRFFVYRRPYLASFLESVGSVFDLAVWSSALARYVSGVVGAVFDDVSRLKFVWAADRCTPRYHPELQERFYLKNLKKVRRLGYSLERVLMVDDSPEKLSQHYGNHVRVRPFTGDPGDDELMRLTPFLVGLAGAENFRVIEKRNWRAGK